MDPHICWNNVVPDPVGNPNLSNYLPSLSETNRSQVNVASQESAHLTIRSQGGTSSSGLLNQGNCSESKMEREWSTSLTMDAAANSRMEDRQLEAASQLSLNNMRINLNSNLVANDHLYSHNSNLGDGHQNIGQNSFRDGIINQAAETDISHHRFTPSLSDREHFPPITDTSNSFSIGASFLSEDVIGRHEGALDGRRISCKRKNIEGVAGPSSTNESLSSFRQSENSLFPSHTARHNATTSINVFNSPDHVAGSNASEAHLNQTSGTITRGLAYDSALSLTIAENAESSQRSFRMRINPAHQRDISPPNLCPPGYSRRYPSICLPPPSNLPVPFSPSLESSPGVPGSSSQTQPGFSSVPSWPLDVQPVLWNRAPNSRIGSSSSSASSAERLNASGEETNSRSVLRNGAPNFLHFYPTADARQLAQDRSNWHATYGSRSVPGNMASTSRSGTNSHVHPSIGSAWVPHNHPSTQRPLRSSQVVNQQLLQPGVPESASQSSNSLPQHTGPSMNSQEIGHQSVAGFRGNQRPLRRSAFLMDRQNDGFSGVPLSIRNLAAREGRNRMISEIRNALDLMSRDVNLRFEDFFILDQSVFLGGADLLDRHRDMRLDVDNMSYEELLALEERIGNVSTGLGEETILKLLKQRNYISPIVVEASQIEPCCICQEEYIEGEEVGTLDCGHDFHTACIKQWLMQKNLCPICKATGLVT